MIAAIDDTITTHNTYNASLSQQLVIISQKLDLFHGALAQHIKAHRQHMEEKKRSSSYMIRQLDQVLLFGLFITVIFYLGTFFYAKRSVLKPLAQLRAQVEAVIAGDLTGKIKISGKDEIGKMGQALHELFSLRLAPIIHRVQQQVESQQHYSGELTAAFHKINTSSEHLKVQANMIANSSNEVSTSIDTAASSTAEAATAIGFMTTSISQLRDSLQALSGSASSSSKDLSTIKRNTTAIFSDIHRLASEVEAVADNLTLANNRCQNARISAESARRTTEESRNVLQQLQAVTDKIGDFNELIDSISAQTSILSLNASIEASRAGEHGRGFATVALEVKELSRQTEEANNEIASQIKLIQQRVKEVINSSEDALYSVQSLVDLNEEIATMINSQDQLAKTVAEMVESISHSSNESSGRISAVTDSLQHIFKAVRDASNASSILSSAADAGAENSTMMVDNANVAASQAAIVNDNLQHIRDEVIKIDTNVNSSEKISKELDVEIKQLEQLVSFFRT